MWNWLCSPGNHATCFKKHNHSCPQHRAQLAPKLHIETNNMEFEQVHLWHSRVMSRLTRGQTGLQVYSWKFYVSCFMLFSIQVRPRQWNWTSIVHGWNQSLQQMPHLGYYPKGSQINVSDTENCALNTRQNLGFYLEHAHSSLSGQEKNWSPNTPKACQLPWMFKTFNIEQQVWVPG